MEKTDSSARDVYWKVEMEQCHKGIHKLFTNDIRGAEAIFLQGFMKDGVILEPPGSEKRDLRFAYGMGNAICSFILGVATFEKDQLDDCLERIWIAEKLTHVNDWLGNRLMGGLCYLIAGVIRVIQHSWIKAAYCIIKSWRIIQYLGKECEVYKGVERPEIISCHELCVGVFNLVVSLLPPLLVKVASVLGFHGDRKKALELIHNCWKAEAMFSPVAAAAILSFHLEIKTFLGEECSEEELALCEEVLVWGEKKYPGGIVFIFNRANLHFAYKDPYKGVQLLKSLEPVAQKLPAVKLPIYLQRGMWEATYLDWDAAKRSFAEAHTANEAGGRRSHGPWCAYWLGLCALASGDEDEGKAAFAAIQAYSTMNKSNWRPVDSMALWKGSYYASNPEAFVPILELAEILCTTIGFKHFREEDLQNLKLALGKCFQEHYQSWTADDLCRTYCLIAFLLLAQKEWEKAETNLGFAIKYMQGLTERGEKNGTSSRVYYALACIRLEQNKFDEASKHLSECKTVIHKAKFSTLLSFRVHSLEARIEAKKVKKM